MEQARAYVRVMSRRKLIQSLLLAFALLVAVAVAVCVVSSADAGVCDGVCLEPSHLGFKGSGRVSFVVEGAFTLRVATGSLDGQARRGSSITLSGSVFPLYTEPAPGATVGALVSQSGELVFAKEMRASGFCPTACRVDAVGRKIAGIIDGAARYTFFGTGGWGDSFGHTGSFCPQTESVVDCAWVIGDAANSATFVRMTGGWGTWDGAAQPLLPKTRNGTYSIDRATLDAATAMRQLYAVGDGATPPLPKP